MFVVYLASTLVIENVQARPGVIAACVAAIPGRTATDAAGLGSAALIIATSIGMVWQAARLRNLFYLAIPVMRRSPGRR
jgi:hypothetical protein